MIVWIWALSSVVVVSLVSLVGIAFVTLRGPSLDRFIFIATAFATGALFAGAFVHLLPESFSVLGNAASWYVLAGIGVFFLLEKVLRWHHPHLDKRNGTPIAPFGYLNLLADGLHNYIDGVLIGSAYIIDVRIGMATTVAVLLHEIPQEIGDFGVLLRSGFSKRRALLFNFLTASLATLGACTSLLVGDVIERFAIITLPVAAGGFIYIAGSDLVPVLQEEVSPSRSILQFLALISGALIMLAFK